MEFKQLEVFVAVVEWNSFSQAAKSLFLTQPTVSSHISSLERELNTKLIFRTTKNIEITKEGMLLYEYARSILKIKEKIYDEFSNTAPGLIRIGTSTFPSSYILPSLISEIKTKFPDTRFDIFQSDSVGIIEKIIEGSIDIGIVGTKTNQEQCIFIPICRDELVVVTPINERFKQLKEKNASLKEILMEPILLREDGSGTQKEAKFFLERLGIDFPMLNVVGKMTDQSAINKMIATGVGISIMSKKTAFELKESGAAIIFEDKECPIYREIYIVYHKNRAPLNRILNIIDIIKTI